jgi:hypothetical protein
VAGVEAEGASYKAYDAALQSRSEEPFSRAEPHSEIDRARFQR